jgi:prepilin-type N-terminal cleavage/methylation domain-containing protein
MKILKFDKAGFTLIELLVVMGLLVIVLAISSGNFTTLLRALKGESKTAETEVEKIVGLEILRQDIENSGYGLPWFVDTNNWSALNGYSEASSQTECGTNNINTYNDAPNNAPRAIISGDNVCSDGSDYLVIKSSVVRNLAEAQKWTYIWNDGVTRKNTWPTANENIKDNSKVIAINPKENVRERTLVTYTINGQRRFYSTFSASTSNYQLKLNEVYLLFAIGDDNDSSIRMPFNRADYFINKNNVPSRCASGTGVLTKATLSHGDGKLSDYSPLLDCVADMQIVFGVDITIPSADGRIDCYTNDLSVAGITDAENIRNRIKEVRIYILTHEGQYDRDYRFGSSIIRVGDTSGLNRCDPTGIDQILGRDFDLSTSGITNWQNYRWKVYTLVVSPDNLRGR